MIRHAAAVVIVLLLSPSWVTAQGTELTVNASAASVHKAPSTASPVIGQAARGTRLAVTRNVGDWGEGRVAIRRGWCWVRASERGLRVEWCRLERHGGLGGAATEQPACSSVPPLSHRPV